MKKLAIQTWLKIGEGRSLNFQLKELTFTDLNMLELKKSHPSKIHTKVFNQTEEGIKTTTTKTTVFQCDKLINDAFKPDYPMLPFYVLYFQVDEKDRLKMGKLEC